VYAGKQFMDGVPVEYGLTRVLVLNTATDHRVVSVGAKLAQPPSGGFKPDAVGSADAVLAVQKMQAFQDLTIWGAPEMVVFTGQDEFDQPIEAVRAWKFTGEHANPEAMRTFTFFVDAASGDLVHARYDIHQIDVTGSVQAWVTPAPLGNAAADHAGNPPSLRGVPDIRVRINGSDATSAFTDDNGNFTIPWAGTTPVTVDCSVGNGEWVDVADAVGLALQSASASVTPGTPVNFILNGPTGRSEQTTAHVNAFTYVTLTHNHWKLYAPTSPVLDLNVVANTQVSGTCNAFFSPANLTTNYYNSGGGCNNTAFSSVVSHEYGHYIVNRLGLAQGGFGEGFGDTMSMMMYDDPVIGRFFQTTGNPVRTPDTANQQYPCTSTAVHTCGQILGNIVWEIRRSYGNLLGTTLGRELARQQHVDWARITTGGAGTNTLNSAHPLTVEQWLTIDDNDGNIGNGTPHYAQICGAFAQGGITCPPLDLIDFVYPDGLPTQISTSAGATFRVNVVAASAGTPQPGTGRLYYSVDGGAFTNVAMTQGAANQYTATIPAAACGSQVQYYVSAEAVGGTVVFDPALAPASSNSAIAGSSVTATFTDTFESAGAWVVGPNTATTGLWERGNPNGSAAQPEDDVTPGAGANCFFTGQAAAGAAVGTNDVDGGATVLTSPTFDATGGCTAFVEYWRWYNNSAGSAPYEDSLVVQISSNNGSTWTTLETIGPGSAANNVDVIGGWRFSQINLADVPGLARTSTMKVRFTAADAGSGSIVEAAVDDFRVVVVGNAGCVADVDDGSGTGTPDGGVTIDDLLYYLGIFEAGSVAADVDDGSGTGTPDGGVTIDDLLYFLTRFEAGC